MAVFEINSPLLKVGVFLWTASMTNWARAELSGRVTDMNGTPLANVTVERIGPRQSVITDEEGKYFFSKRVSYRSDPVPSSPPSLLRGRFSPILVNRSEKENSDFTDIQGKRQTPGRKFQKREEGNSELIRLSHSAVPLKSPASAHDSLHFNIQGYEDAVFPVSGTGSGPLPDIRLKPGLSFEPFFTGSGVITDFVTGKPVRIAKENMYHVLYLGDGYTQHDIRAGRYRADAKRWYDDVFRLAPLNSFKEAFVIWTLPVPSPNRTGQGATYFETPFGGSWGNKGVTARRIWELLDRHPFKPKHFDGGTARNWVVQMAVLDPQAGRSGFSGHASTHFNPKNHHEAVQTALAQSHHHEFLHSFGRLADEYHHRGHRGARFSKTANVTPENRCNKLPWKHLLYGSEFNPGADSLVGAFGHPDKARFHSELKCLMNGSHQNSEIYGGSDYLRSPDRLCNWCRELAMFRLYHGLGLIPGGAGEAFALWEKDYRRPFWEAFPFAVPGILPQTNSEGHKWFMNCVAAD